MFVTCLCGCCSCNPGGTGIDPTDADIGSGSGGADSPAAAVGGGLMNIDFVPSAKRPPSGSTGRGELSPDDDDEGPAPADWGSGGPGVVERAAVGADC